MHGTTSPGAPQVTERLISVILPTFKSAAWMRGALDSLVVQTERDFEVVVSDGASPDTTLAVAESYRACLPSLTLLSRPDRGVYDAINLAIAACRGRWVLVLGSDDKLHAPDTLAQMARTLRTTSAQLVYGDVRVLGPNAMVADGARYGGPFTLARLMGQNICHQAIFTRTVLFTQLGVYDLRYELWADWHFAQRAFAQIRTQWVDLVVADYAATGLSSATLDTAFQRTVARRMLQLWLSRPSSLAVPFAVVKNAYWNFRKNLSI